MDVSDADDEQTVRVALVGLGAIGRGAHLPALSRNPSVELAMLVDPDAERQQLAAHQAPGIATAANVDDVLADETIRAIVLATPPWATTSLARRLLSAGRYVLAEKPIAPSLAEADPLRELGAATLARLQIGLTYRHDPAMRQLRDWISGGRLGSPLLVRAHVYDERHDRDDAEHTARIVETLAHGSPAIHEGAHVFDWLRYLLGDPLHVDDAWGIRTVADLPAPNLTGARITYPGGTVAMVEFGWLTDQLPRCELSFLGSRGHALLDGSNFALTLHTADGTERAEFPGERITRSFDRQLAAFVDLVSGRTSAGEPGLDDALASLRIGEEMKRLLSP